MLVLDTVLLAHFARADRLDVLRELLVGHECSTTYVVLEELRRGLPDHPDQRAVLELEWVTPIQLGSVVELECFARSVERIGAGERNLGEASVFAVAERPCRAEVRT